MPYTVERLMGLETEQKDDWPFADGDAARRVGELDWSQTALGPREAWTQRQRAAIEMVLASDAPMVTLIGPGMVAIGNDALATVTGQADVPLGDGVVDLLGIRDAAGRLRAGRSAAGEPIRVRNRLLRPSHTPLRDDQGRVEGVLSRFDPIEDAATLSLDDQRHRTRNMLALIRSVARRTAEGEASLEGYLQRFEGRLDAMARVQAMLAARSEGVDVWELTGEEALAAGLREGEALAIEGPDVTLLPRAAEVVGIALHELFTYAAELATVGGTRSSLLWQRSADGNLHLAWSLTHEPNDPREDEAGSEVPDLATPLKEGFGRDVLGGMVPYELDARADIQFEDGRLRCEIVLPATLFSLRGS